MNELKRSRPKVSLFHEMDQDLNEVFKQREEPGARVQERVKERGESRGAIRAAEKECIKKAHVLDQDDPELFYVP